MLHDVVVVGGGPAGCVAATVLARAGARVLLLDRARFPRDKLCGDTLNPGAVTLLRRLQLDDLPRALPLHGMLVSGPGGVRVCARYPENVTGRAVVRRDLDQFLLARTAAAGVAVEEGTAVAAVTPGTADGTAPGVVVRTRRGVSRELRARLVIAADGRASVVARALGLARVPRHPRRWAIGAYFTDVPEIGDYGEMHIRHGGYIGVAPVPGGLTNVCVVTGDRTLLATGPEGLLRRVLAGDPLLAERFASARMVTAPVSLGPLAVNCDVPGTPGLLLAGDAAGFIDPMTGDGLRLAMRGAELAADEGLRVLTAGHREGHRRLAARRRREFGTKMRMNRALRRLIESPAALRVAGAAARVSAWPVARIVRYAGDVRPAGRAASLR